MAKFDALGISSYYDSLPRGQKDVFKRDVAEAIEKSVPTIQLRIKTGKWTMIELDKINELIKTQKYDG